MTRTVFEWTLLSIYTRAVPGVQNGRNGGAVRALEAEDDAAMAASDRKKAMSLFDGCT